MFPRRLEAFNRFSEEADGESYMRTEEYRDHLHEQGVTGDEIEKRQMIIGDFISFLTDPGLGGDTATAGKAEVEKYARKLIMQGRNSLENFSALCDYTRWCGLRKLYVALIEVMDCHNALAVLADRIEERHGRESRERIFCEALPPLGADERERWAYTRTIMKRMGQQLSPQEIRAAWYQVQHGIPPDAWHESDLADREKYQRCRDLDEFLDLKRRERDALLTRLRDEDKLWYTVLINDQVLEFIINDPKMETGRREGDKIYITKIPYNAVRYLHETDPQMKRYYACHCPLVREAILQGQPVSPEVCDCSLGHASHYLAGLGQQLRGEVLESAVRGDTRCRFVFYLPDSGVRW
jgi:hypothetical protein